MKRITFYLTLMAGLFAGALPCTSFADDAADTTAATSSKKSKKSNKSKKGKKAERKVGELGKKLEGITYLTANKPDFDATHYIFINSASWCGPCKAIMPKIVEQYAEMKAAGVEVILVANEPGPAAAKYLEGYNAQFAGAEPVQLNGIDIPNGQPIPNMVLMDADGKVITSGHGRMVLQWRQLTGQPVVDDGKPGAVATAIADMKFLVAKPSKKAKYYIYLHSSSTCVACKSVMPSIVKEYKKMKSKDVEIILLSHDSTEEAAKDYVKSIRAKFPTMMDADENARKLPGYTPVSGIPQAVIVDKNGNVVKQGHGNLVLEWKTLCP